MVFESSASSKSIERNSSDLQELLVGFWQAVICFCARKMTQLSAWLLARR